MKILKASYNEYCGYHLCVDKIPEITYEKMGSHYIGTATYKKQIIFSHFLKYSKSTKYSKAFAGREITLKMKDGSAQIIKDDWWDAGSYTEDGTKYIHVGLATIDSLRNCYVFYAYNINEKFFKKMLNDYFLRDKLYESDEIRKWIFMQQKFYPAKYLGNQIDGIMVSEYGDIVNKYTKEIEGHNVNYFKIKNLNGKYKTFSGTIFKCKKNKYGKYIYEGNYLKLLMESLPHLSRDEIIKRCKLKDYYKFSKDDKERNDSNG